MKSTVAMLAVIFLVTTLAMAQNSLPFPQAANPALESAPYAVVVPAQSSPSSMAANVGGATIEIAPAYRSNNADNGSPFPTAANPSLGAASEAPLVNEQRHKTDSGSPFPMAADPSSTNW